MNPRAMGACKVLEVNPAPSRWRPVYMRDVILSGQVVELATASDPNKETPGCGGQRRWRMHPISGMTLEPILKAG
jgi:hypothetical protein